MVQIISNKHAKDKVNVWSYDVFIITLNEQATNVQWTRNPSNINGLDHLVAY